MSWRTGALWLACLLLADPAGTATAASGAPPAWCQARNWRGGCRDAPGGRGAADERCLHLPARGCGSNALLRLRGGSEDQGNLLKSFLKNMCLPAVDASPFPRDTAGMFRALDSLDDDGCYRLLCHLPGGVVHRAIRRNATAEASDPASPSEPPWVHLCARRGLDRTLKKLISLGAHVDTPGPLGQTPLHVASDSEAASENTINLLCEAGASIDAKDMLGWTALHHASFGGNLDKARLLVDRWKACTEHCNDRGETAADVAEARFQQLNASLNGTALDDAEAWERHSQHMTTAVFMRSLMRKPASTGNAQAPEKEAKALKVKKVSKAVDPVINASAATAREAIAKLETARLRDALLREEAARRNAEAAWMRLNKELKWLRERQEMSLAGARARAARYEREAEDARRQVAEAMRGLQAARVEIKQRASLSGRVCGVGITLRVDEAGGYVVKKLTPDGPADECGYIAVGDVLTKVDGCEVKGLPLSGLAGWMLGMQGSKTMLAFARGGNAEDVFEVELTREPLPSDAAHSTQLVVRREQECVARLAQAKSKLLDQNARLLEQIAELKARIE